MLIFFLSLASALTEDKIDDYCYLFSSNYVQGMAESITNHVASHPELEEIQVTSKAIEQAFYSCIKNLNEEHVKKFNSHNIDDFSLYKDFINLDLEKFQTPGDLKLTRLFNNKRRVIAERARRKSKEKEDKENKERDL